MHEPWEDKYQFDDQEEDEMHEDNQARVAPSVPCVETTGSTAEPPTGAVTDATRPERIKPLTYGGHECHDLSPPWFTGRWRDWHRGHGCRLDDGKPRSREALDEIDRESSNRLRQRLHWAVTVSRDGEEIVTIGHNHLSGRDLTAEDEEAIRTAARNLLGFVGDSWRT